MWNDGMMEQWTMELWDAGFPSITTFQYSKITTYCREKYKIIILIY